MIKINYGTSEHFEEKIGDKHYCRSLASAKKELIRLMKNDDIKQIHIGKIIGQFETHVFNKKSTMCWESHVNLIDSEIDLFIGVEEITLV